MEIQKNELTIPLIHNLPGKDVPSKDFLIHPLVDVLMMGGLSIIFFVGVHFFVEPSSRIDKIGWLMFYLSFAVNYPHFMASYVLIYKDYRSELFTNWKFTWAGIIAPALLVSAMVGLSLYAVSQNDISYLGYLPSLMFFLVGHHYVKQVYGCVIVSSAKKKFYFRKAECLSLWASMYSVWMMSFISSNIYIINTHKFYGIEYKTLGLDARWLTVVYAVTFLTASIFLGLMVKRYIKDGKILPLSAWTALVAIYLWYIPAFYNAHYYYMIPFFHSLQYLLFSISFYKNKACDHSSGFEDPSVARADFLKKLGGFVALIVVLGFLFWQFIPNQLNSRIKVSPLLGPTIFIFCFQIFLNLHHYLIDNVIWRKDNEQMKKYI